MYLIRPNLYQGSIKSLDYVDQYQITHVLTLCPNHVQLSHDIEAFGGLKNSSGSATLNIVHLDMPISDWGPIAGKQLEACFDFIDEGRKQGNVLIHCFAGMNRSVAITMAYMMYKQDLTWEEALIVVKNVNDLADPGVELRSWILKYFEKLFR